MYYQQQMVPPQDPANVEFGFNDQFPQITDGSVLLDPLTYKAQPLTEDVFLEPFDPPDGYNFPQEQSFVSYSFPLTPDSHTDSPIVNQSLCDPLELSLKKFEKPLTPPVEGLSQIFQPSNLEQRYNLLDNPIYSSSYPTDPTLLSTQVDQYQTCKPSETNSSILDIPENLPPVINDQSALCNSLPPENCDISYSADVFISNNYMHNFIDTNGTSQYESKTVNTLSPVSGSASEMSAVSHLVSMSMNMATPVFVGISEEQTCPKDISSAAEDLTHLLRSELKETIQKKRKAKGLGDIAIKEEEPVMRACELTVEDEERRTRRRERNKVAASKCRKKKTEHEINLHKVGLLWFHIQKYSLHFTWEEKYFGDKNSQIRKEILALKEEYKKLTMMLKSGAHVCGLKDFV